MYVCMYVYLYTYDDVAIENVGLCERVVNK